MSLGSCSKNYAKINRRSDLRLALGVYKFYSLAGAKTFSARTNLGIWRVTSVGNCGNQEPAKRQIWLTVGFCSCWSCAAQASCKILGQDLSQDLLRHISLAWLGKKIRSCLVGSKDILNCLGNAVLIQGFKLHRFAFLTCIDELIIGARSEKILVTVIRLINFLTDQDLLQ